jgi:hypothetical protein
VQAVHAKTRDVLQKLRGIAGEGSVTQEVMATRRRRFCGERAHAHCRR